MGWAQTFEIPFLEAEQLIHCSADKYFCTRHMNRLFCNSLWWVNVSTGIFIMSVPHICLWGEHLNSTGVSVIVFPTQHKIIWAEISPRYLFLLFSEQKKIFVSMKHLFYWQIVPYFWRKFQNKVSIFTSTRHKNFFPIFSPGQWDFLHTVLASSSQGYQSEAFHEKALKYLCCSMKLKKVSIIFRRHSQN